jgi:uncharacterized protein YdhG (YjbR/CyaY superfamily)
MRYKTGVRIKYQLNGLWVTTGLMTRAEAEEHLHRYPEGEIIDNGEQY